jgi:threonine synthase
MTAAPHSAPGHRATCIGCGRRHDVRPGVYHCNCARQENLSIDYDLGATMRAALLECVAEGESSMWRYAPLLPVDRRFRSPLSVGWTPLYDFGGSGGTHFYIKDDTRNPSGTLKDRASEIVVAAAAAHGIGEVIVASTGNAAASLACIGAAARIKVTILVPRTVPDAKLAQIVAYGASVYKVDGTYDDAYVMAQKVAAANGIFNRSTGLNPYTREGKKTCAFEIAEQLGWQAPDWVIVPAGDGNILSALWKGFEELAALGLLSRLPRMVAAQAVASSAIARAFDPEWAKTPLDASARTIADSITVGNPCDMTAVLRALTMSRGRALAVDDTEIVAAVGALAARFGVFAEPSSAAAFAVFERLRHSGAIERDARVVCLATGTGLKDLRPVLRPEALEGIRVIGRDAWQDIAIGPAVDRPAGC